MRIRNTNRLTEENKLTNKYPILARQWNDKKNGELKPSMVSYGSNLKVWWKCENDHEWEQVIKARAKSEVIGECKICKKESGEWRGRKLIPGNSLAERCPEAMEYWDYQKNNGKRPEEYSFTKTDEVWWKCENGHSFKRRINDFRLSKNKCKKCAEIKNKKPLRTLNKLSNYDFDFISEFNEEKNGLTTAEISIKSSLKYWWKCENGHEWQDSPKHRMAGFGCQECVKRRYYRLEKLDEHVRIMWNTERNEISNDGQYHYNKKVWWKCENGHEWEEDLRCLEATNYICAECKGIKQERKYSLQLLKPELAKKLDSQKNCESAENINVMSREKYWWKCEKGHSLHKTIKEMEEIKKCSECAGVKLRKVNPNESIADVYPERAKMWHPTLNGILEPTDFSFGTTKRFWWICENGHSSYETVIMKLANGVQQIKKCEQCKKEPGIYSLAHKYPHLLEYWDEEKNNVDPNKVLADSKITYRWKCNVGHSWRERINKQLDNDGCPICKGNVFLKPSPGKSFAEVCPELVPMWDQQKNGELTPWDVTYGSSIKIWWKCEEGHSFMLPINSLKVRVNKCEVCKNKELDKLRKMWDVEKNGGEFDENTTKTSKEKHWYKCENGHSEWLSPLQIYTRVGCKKCKKEGK